MPRFGIQCDLHSAIQTLSLTNGFPSKLPWKYLNLMDCNIYEHGSSLSGCMGLLMAQAERWESIPAAQGNRSQQHRGAQLHSTACVGLLLMQGASAVEE